MNSLLNRGQQVFGYFTTVAFTVASVIAISVVLIPQAPTAELQPRNVQVVKGRPHYYSTKREEYAHIKFDLDADLSSLFNWNTKQLFVYITATYPSTDPGRVPDSEVVVWDAIIPADNAPWHPNTWIHPTPKSSDDAAKNKKKKAKKSGKTAGKPYPEGGRPGIVTLQNQRPKYQVTDISGKMAERDNATLTLHWNVQPWVGFLTWTNRQTIGRWEGLQGGEAHFEFPAIKGSTDGKKEDLNTEKGAERNRGKPA